nr:phage tail tape measure protein [Pedobacter sp. ASV19]
MASKDEVRRVSIYINGTESDLTLKQLTAGSAKLRNELAQLVPGTDAFIKKAQELRQVNDLLRGVREDVNGVSGAFAALKDGIETVKNTLLAGLGLDAIVSTIKDVVAQNAILSDSLSDVQKTTGLTQASVLHLNESLKQINTRTAQEDLLGLAKVAGKLGISAETDVLAFVKAADQINVALGEDLGGAEEAINSLGKLTDIFKIKAEYGLEESLLKTGSAINELGAAGTANEGFLVSFAGRLAGIAPAANMSIQNVLGLGAVMDELQQPVEASATAIGQFVVGLGKDIPKFAGIAKMSVKDFSDLLNKDGNEALIRVLQNVKSAGQGVQGLAESMGMVGEDGARAVTALGALSNNLDLLQKRQALSNWEFLKGTSLTNEFDVKNNNLAATLEKIEKKLTAVWTNSDILQGITYIVKLIYDNISALGEMIKILAIATVAWGTYRIAVALATTEKLAYIKALIGAETLEKLNIVTTTTLGLAKALLTGNLRKAKQEWALLNATMSANPYALLIAGVVALGAAFYLYSSRLSDAEKAQKVINDLQAEAEKSVAGEKNRLISLIDVIKNESLAKQDRIAKVKELRDIMPGYLKMYTDEEILAGKATVAIGQYVAQLERRARIDAALKKLTELDEEKINIDQKIADGPKGEGYWDRVKRGFTTGNNTDGGYVKGLKQQKADIEKQQALIREQMNKNIVDDTQKPTASKGVDNTVGHRIEELKNQINILELAYNRLNKTDKKGMADNIQQRKALQKELDQISGSTKDPKKDPTAEKNKRLFKEAEQERIASLERTAQAIMDSYAKELSETDEHFRKLQAKHSTNSAAVAQIEKERVAKLKEIEEKFRKDDLATLVSIQNETSQIATEAMTRETDRQLEEIRNATKLKLQQLDKEDTEIREKIAKQQASIESLRKSGKNDEAAILENAVTRELDILDKSGKLREAFLKSQGAKEAQIIKTAEDNKQLSRLEAAVINADSLNPNSKSALEAHVNLLEKKHQLAVEEAIKTLSLIHI